MIIQKRIKEIIRKLAAKHDLTEDQVVEVVFSSFGLVKKAMKDAAPDAPATFKNVRIMNLGIFAVKPGRVKKLNEKNEEK